MLRAILITTLAGYVSVKCIRFLLKLYWGKIDPSNEISVENKLVLITGANSGIGKQTAMEMAKRGARVIMACRDLTSTLEAIVDIRMRTKNGELIPMKLDLGSLESIREFATEFNGKFSSLDILINNAGVYVPISKKAKTQDGFEIHFGVNHLGHFLLTNLLLESLKKAAPSRIVTLSSLLHNVGEIDFADLMSERKNYTENIASNPLYANSKLANALFNKELAKRLRGSGVTSYALCPGVVATNISRSLDIPFYYKIFTPLYYLFVKSPEEGALTSLYCALSKDVATQSGEMYQHCHFWDPSKRVLLKDEDAVRLWEVSEELVGLK